ncbi:putative Zn-dependent peptidase [Weissella uvarum]|uniref:EF-P 5-aminopentanol modification-associated protein YfmH n=1 Tax=Weissella uvarum TaxID=1479233 RepID=UPI001961410E|nr:pitrilysin family protein [Weissella uvarum]MBM7617131.1 putative Zn-dependent peptidase [Weissella uvarum]MCM0595427.1 insulinase family protein [Weissella uvarum]
MQIKALFPPEQHYTLPNGLQIHLAPRPDFHQMAANLTVDFGGRDTQFNWQGQAYHQPTGIAHFLEHRMFGQADYDAFQRLSELGADANAFTSQSRTSYYFTSLANNLAAITELLNFTQVSYFPETAVTREAKIIQQEADMYQDNVDSQIYRLLMEQLYPHDGLAEELVGNATSLAQISAKDLQIAFDAFYQPANMDLFITGAFDEIKLKQAIEESVAGQRIATQPAQIHQPTLAPAKTAPKEVRLPTQQTKVALGQRFSIQQSLPTGREALKVMLAVSLALDLVFGELSPDYMAWYDEALIDDDFSIDFEWERGFAFISAAGHTNEPERLIEVVSDAWQHLPELFAQLRHEFPLVKQATLGRMVNRFNFMEDLVVNFEGNLFDAATTLDEFEILAQLDADTVADILEKMDRAPISKVIIRPM